MAFLTKGKFGLIYICTAFDYTKDEGRWFGDLEPRRQSFILVHNCWEKFSGLWIMIVMQTIHCPICFLGYWKVRFQGSWDEVINLGQIISFVFCLYLPKNKLLPSLNRPQCLHSWNSFMFSSTFLIQVTLLNLKQLFWISSHQVHA